MTEAASLLVRALREPRSVSALDAEGWTAILAAARAEQLIGSLADRLEGQPLPSSVADILADARRAAEQGRVHALWEAERAQQAVAPLGVPMVLLKGTAFLAGDLAAGRGRFVGDLDILVPRSALEEVEAALLDHGWEWVKDDPYDSHYYRRWMHELPPLIHRTRDRMIDVHHNILPMTSRCKPDPAALIADSVILENCFRTLSPADMIVHAAAHLFADGDLSGGLRNLWDIDRLVHEFSAGQYFWARLGARARRHGLERETGRALRLCHALFGTAVDVAVAGAPRRADRDYVRRLLARDGWGRPTHGLTRLGFYVRSHWIRMPPMLLARHLWTKALKTPTAV